MVFIFGLFLVIFLISLMYLERENHKKKMENLKFRVHVNGIRGKSSVTRLIAGVLRAGKYNTLAKVTGNSPNIINIEGDDIPINRKGPANVIEQVKIINKYVDKNIDAVVLECMAVKPKFQKFLEEQVVNSNVSIITNIREDHMEELGYTLEEIAENLALTLPKRGGHCITSEDNIKLVDLLRKKCEKRETEFHHALEYRVSDSYMKKFKHREHKSNVQIGVALADVLGIPKNKALEEMLLVKPEKEVLTLKKFLFGNKTLIWSNMFSINDKESCIINWKSICEDKNIEKNATKVCILNNREDRPDRTIQFLELICEKMKFELNISFGAFKDKVFSKLTQAKRKVLIADDLVIKNPEKFVQQIFEKTNSNCVILFGLMNIHTPQAKALIDYLESLDPIEQS